MSANPVSAFDHVSLPMQDTDAMVAFYRALGFDVAEYPHVVSVYVGKQMINFHRPATWQRERFTLRAPKAVPPCGDLCFVWDAGPEALTALLDTAGAAVIEGPVAREGGRRAAATSVYVRDPDGNLLEFMIYETETALMAAEIVIRGGTVYDGSGAPGRVADVAIADGVVQEIGSDLRGDRELDASGCAVAPGFIDIHTHYDAQVFWDPALRPTSYHGVTTVVAGNCGFSIAPTRPEHRDLDRRHPRERRGHGPGDAQRRDRVGVRDLPRLSRGGAPAGDRSSTSPRTSVTRRYGSTSWATPRTSAPPPPTRSHT